MLPQAHSFNEENASLKVTMVSRRKTSGLNSHGPLAEPASYLQGENGGSLGQGCKTEVGSMRRKDE